MAEGMALPRVITNDLLHCEQTHFEPTREVLGANTTRPAVARVGTMSSNSSQSVFPPNPKPENKGRGRNTDHTTHPQLSIRPRATTEG